MQGTGSEAGYLFRLTHNYPLAYLKKQMKSAFLNSMSYLILAKQGIACKSGQFPEKFIIKYT